MCAYAHGCRSACTCNIAQRQGIGCLVLLRCLNKLLQRRPACLCILCAGDLDVI